MNIDTTEIRFADLAAMLLKAFKPILFATLLFAVLGCGIGIVNSFINAKNIASFEEKLTAAEEAAESSKKNADASENALSTWKEVQIPLTMDTIEHAESLLVSRQEYLDNSLYYSIDPFRCGVSRSTVKIEPRNDDEVNAAVLMTALTSAVSDLSSNNGELLGELQRILSPNADYAYIKELFSVSVPSDGLVEITVFHFDPQTAEKAADAICEQLIRYLGRDPRFSCEIISRFCGYEVNWEMRDRQLASKGLLISAEQSLTDAREKLQRLKEEIPNIEEEVDNANSAYKEAKKALAKAKQDYEESALSAKNIAKRSLRYAAVMFFIGLLISCFFVLVYGVLGGKLQNRSVVLTNCEYPLLGNLPCEKKRLFEKTIRTLEGESKDDYQTAVEAVAQTLLSLSNDRHTCFVSSLGKDVPGSLVSLLAERIPVCGDIASDSEAIKTLSSFDSIVLIEKKGKSKLAMIDNEIQRAKVFGKDILGIVLI